MKQFILLSILIFASCAKEDITESYGLCLFGECSVELSIDPVSSPDAYIDANGYWNVPFTGSKYFTVVANYDNISGEYVTGAGPMIKTEWDSNYWFTAVNGITMWSSLYNPLGSNYSANFTFAYASETREITVDLGEVEEIFNLSGRYMRDESIGSMPETMSTRTYKSKKPFIFLEGMKGDTLDVYAYTTYAWDSPKAEQIESVIKVILQ